MNRRGQAATEMVFLMPILIMLLGACIFVVYTSWQGIRVQQAANLAARIQGQERVAGGKDTGAIDEQNGDKQGDDPKNRYAGQPRSNSNNTNSVFARYSKLVREMFPQSPVFVLTPEIGQNVDKVGVVRVVKVPKIPYFDGTKTPKEIVLEGHAWGGEDTFMYALPRWGETGKSHNLAWKDMIKDPTNSKEHD